MALCSNKKSGISLVCLIFSHRQCAARLTPACALFPITQTSCSNKYCSWLFKIHFLIFNSFSLCRAYLNTSQKNLTAVKSIAHPARLNCAVDRILFAFNKCPANIAFKRNLISFSGIVGSDLTV